MANEMKDILEDPSQIATCWCEMDSPRFPTQEQAERWLVAHCAEQHPEVGRRRMSKAVSGIDPCAFTRMMNRMMGKTVPRTSRPRKQAPPGFGLA